MDHYRRWKNYCVGLICAAIAAEAIAAQEQIKISELPKKTTLANTNLFLITVIGEGNYNITAIDLKKWLTNDISQYILLPWQFVLYGDVPPQLNNSRKLTPGTNISFGLTSTSLVVNATGGGGSSGLPTPPSTNAALLTAVSGQFKYGAISNFLFNGNTWFMPINAAWFEWHPVNGLQIKDGVNFKIGSWLSADGNEIAQFKSAAEGKDNNTIVRKGDLPAMHIATDIAEDAAKVGLKKSIYAFRPFMLDQVAVSLNSVQTNGPAFTLEVRKNSNLVSVISIENDRHLALVAAAEPFGIGDRIDYQVTQMGKGAAGVKVYLIGQ